MLKVAGRPATSGSGTNELLPGRGADFAGHVQQQLGITDCKQHTMLLAQTLLVRWMQINSMKKSHQQHHKLR